VASVYESNIRFEHCYRLDLDPNIAPSHREACWQEWSQRYTYGQTRDRLEYARRRMAALHAGDERRPELNLDAGGEGGPTAPPEAPLPTSANAAPPPTLKSPVVGDAGVDASAGSAQALVAKPPPPPGAGCIADCQELWRQCNSECADAGPKRAGCKNCQPDYRRCVQRCFK
jgi:hypothetical protein